MWKARASSAHAAPANVQRIAQQLSLVIVRASWKNQCTFSLSDGRKWRGACMLFFSRALKIHTTFRQNVYVSVGVIWFGTVTHEPQFVLVVLFSFRAQSSLSFAQIVE